jgi:hypothetical protein
LARRKEKIMATSVVHPTAHATTRMHVAVVAAAGFIGLALFQVALALGAPLGEAAYGGTHTDLPVALRLTSAFAAIVYGLATLVVLRCAGYRVPLVGGGVARVGTWVLAGLLPLAALMNFASSSGWERFGWGPTALVLGILCFLIARASRQSSHT